MEVLLQITAFYIISIFMVIFYFHQRLNAQDKYISTYMRALASHKNADDFTLVPVLDSSKPEKETKKPEVYSPRYDPETIMSGKVLDPFD